MSFLQIDNIGSVTDITTNDELDVMATSSPVVPARTNKLPADDSKGRALRPRRSAGITIIIPASRKRSRAMSDSTLVENYQEEAKAKKLKWEDKRAVCIPEPPPHLFPD